ncbi:MAG: hypothetical protein QXS27_07720 [Candidatus Jordarchaeaceae archaeon]
MTADEKNSHAFVLNFARVIHFVNKSFFYTLKHIKSFHHFNEEKFTESWKEINKKSEIWFNDFIMQKKKNKKNKKRKTRSESSSYGPFDIPPINLDFEIPRVDLSKFELPRVEIPEIKPPKYKSAEFLTPDLGGIDSSVADLSDAISSGIGALSEFLKKRKMKKTLPENVKRVVEALESFKPLRSYRNEDRYRMELVGWLKGKDLGADIEIQKGYSRPDIVINNIAIEVKGPTGKEELKTIADKCSRYTLHFDQLIVVLFEVEVDDGYYNEWYRAMQKRFPDVIIIRK